MYKKTLFVILLLQAVSVYSQHIRISADGAGGTKAAVFSVSGEKTAFVDSVQSAGGVIDIPDAGRKYHTGIYKAAFKNFSVEFVYDGNDIAIRTSVSAPADSLSVTVSESNRVYHSFLRLNRAYRTKSELLQLILARYPKDDEYYRITSEKLTSLQAEYSDFIEKQSQTEPHSFAARYIRSARLPIVRTVMPPEKQLAYLKQHALDYVDFNDVELIYSDAFSNKSVEYLVYFRNPQLPKELLEKEFMGAVDSILNRAKKNPIVYKHITEYLVDGFKKFGFDRVIDYILENYVIKDDICLDEKLETTLQRRMDQAKRFKTGVKVPNIIMPDAQGKTIELQNLHGDNILIIFYASWCPHCKEMIPALAKMYREQKEKKLTVVAVSIDTSSGDWLKFVSENCPEWINLCDLKGWAGQAANDYSLFATPTLFLVNSRKEVIAKPAGISDLTSYIR